MLFVNFFKNNTTLFTVGLFPVFLIILQAITISFVYPDFDNDSWRYLIGTNTASFGLGIVLPLLFESNAFSFFFFDKKNPFSEDPFYTKEGKKVHKYCFLAPLDLNVHRVFSSVFTIMLLTAFIVVFINDLLNWDSYISLVFGSISLMVSWFYIFIWKKIYVIR